MRFRTSHSFKLNVHYWPFSVKPKKKLYERECWKTEETKKKGIKKEQRKKYPITHYLNRKLCLYWFAADCMQAQILRVFDLQTVLSSRNGENNTILTKAIFSFFLFFFFCPSNDLHILHIYIRVHTKGFCFVNFCKQLFT